MAQYSTYNVQLMSEQTTLNSLGLKKEYIENMFNLYGYTYQKEEADFSYVIQLLPPKVLKNENKKYTKKTKNPDGTFKETVIYNIDIAVSAHTTIQLINNKTGDVLYESIFSSNFNPTTFQRIDLDKVTADRLYNLKSGDLNQYVISEYKKTLTTQIIRLKRNCAFEKYPVKKSVFSINTKKAPELANTEQEIQTLIQTIENNDFTVDIEVLRKKLNPILQSWKQRASTLKSDDKNQLKLKYAYLFNYAVGSGFLDQYDDALQSCQEAISLSYKIGEAIALKKELKDLSYGIVAGYGFKTRHHNRPEFKAKKHYTFIPTEVVKVRKDPLKGIKQDINEFNSAAKNLALVTYAAAQDLEQGIQKSILHIYGDSVNTRDHRFSTLSFIEDEIEYKFGKGRLKSGSGFLANQNGINTYILDFHKPTPLIEKSGLFTDLNIKFHTRNGMSEEFNADSLVAILQKHENKSLMDISTGSPQDTVKSTNKNLTFPEVKWESYENELSIEVSITYSLIGCLVVNRPYISTNGDKFTIKITDLDKVKVDHLDGTVKDGYMATFTMSAFKLEKHYCSNYDTGEFSHVSKYYNDINFKILIE